VVDHARQVAPALAVGHLVHADEAQPVQPIVARALVLAHHALDHPPHGGPVDAQQARHRRLGGIAGQPHRGVLEGAGEAGAGTGEGKLLAHHAAARAVDAAHLAAQNDARAHRVQVPPAPRRAVVGGARLEAAAGAAHPPALRAGDLHEHLLLAILAQLDADHPFATQPKQSLE
jgi:hypothetical protein